MAITNFSFVDFLLFQAHQFQSNIALIEFDFHFEIHFHCQKG